MAKEKYYGFSDSKSKAEVPTKEDIATAEVDSDEKVYSAKYFNKTIGKLSELKTSIKTSIVAAINKVWDTLEERTNGKVRIYGNAEGGNIEITSKDGIKWEIDANANHLRIYSFGSSNKYVDYTFRYDRAGGVVATVEEVNKKMDKMTVVNNATTTAGGTLLDGRMGKILNDKILAVTNAITTNKAEVGSAYGVTGAYRRNGSIVTVYFYGQHVGDSMGAYTQRNIGTIPANARPPVAMSIPIAGVDYLVLKVDINGLLSIRNEKWETISFGSIRIDNGITYVI